MPNQPQLGTILNEAYNYWTKTLLFQLLFGVIYFFTLMFASAYLFKYYGLFEEVNKFSSLMRTDFPAYFTKFKELMLTENAVNFSLAIMIVKSIIFPLNIGFLKIYRKIDLGENPTFEDIFAGFRGHYFFVYALYALFWSTINNYFLIFPPLSLIWIAAMLFVPAFIFFKNANILKAMSLSFSVFKKNFIFLFIASIVAILFSYCGIIIFFFGIFITFPFWNAMIYTLYKHLVSDFE